MQPKIQSTVNVLLLVVASCATNGCRNTTLVRGNDVPEVVRATHDAGVFRIAGRSNSVSIAHVATVLNRLQSEVADNFELPENEGPVDVIIFPDREQFVGYLHSAFAGLPDRRAFFVATKSGRTIYAYDSSTLIQDLRHEAAHSLLFSRHGALPLWLDEGIAEWFENRAENQRHMRFEELRRDLDDGWIPSLTRLEAITDITDLESQEYREAWCWVEFLMSTEDGRRMLAYYVDEYLGGRERRPLSQIVFREISRPSVQLLRHIKNMDM